MVKTPKKAEVDERNLYLRRLKAENKSSDTGLLQNENRGKAGGVTKMNKVESKKTVKSKLRAPSKIDLAQSAKSANMPPSKEEKKLNAAGKMTKSQIPKMKSDLEESDKKHTKDTKEVNEEVESERPENFHPTEIQKEHSETKSTKSVENETELVEDIMLGTENGQKENGQKENGENENGQPESEQQENGAKDNVESEVENGEMKLQLEPEEVIVEIETHSTITTEVITEEKSGSEIVSETKIMMLEESQTCSIDVVEVTVSDTSEASVSLLPMDGSNNSDNLDQNGEDPALYDTATSLKDVSLPLIDCAKDIPSADEHKEESEPFENPNKEQSFGRTLRGISGRHSISRMRHITLRDHPQSPNSSLFVNTSNSSIPLDEVSSKSLRQRFSLFSSPANGSPAERKRKIDLDESNISKKSKRESTGLLNASFELLKGFRRPNQESTPCKPDKHDISTVSNGEEAVEELPGGRKWCIVM